MPLLIIHRCWLWNILLMQIKILEKSSWSSYYVTKNQWRNIFSSHISQGTGKWNLDMNNCRGQTYDVAGCTIVGKLKGVSTLILQHYPKVVYGHCASHILNMCLVKSLSLWIIQNMMDLAVNLSWFFNNSPKCQGALETTIQQLAEQETLPKRKKVERNV